VAAPLAVFTVLAARVLADGGFSWDDPIVEALDAVSPVSSSDVHVDPLVEGMTLGVGGLTALFAGLLLARRQLRSALFLVGAIGGAVVLSTVVKELVQRPPIEGPADDYSFPSGSATWVMATVAAFSLLAGGRRRRAVLAAGLAIGVAYCAVLTFEQWHYPSDVLAGWCLALAWVAALRLVLFGGVGRAAGRPPSRSG
jgi:membrane-associated phospholipid phosphatase